MSFHLTVEQAVAQLEREKQKPFAVLMKHGTMSIEYFAPKIAGTQTPHSQDEIQVIAPGEATFFRDGERVNCKTGDVLFVPAQMEHHFENFSDDFATWVIFYGKEGGEAL